MAHSIFERRQLLIAIVSDGYMAPPLRKAVVECPGHRMGGYMGVGWGVPGVCVVSSMYTMGSTLKGRRCESGDGGGE